ncbi:hypothetical protein GCM10007939_22820 [Amylibacter marinus]|uniref:Uncharacterized protein n=1 Tax=Amylibacter marinus TaxID=1475483 RepID=A0ABQ5VY27_9RHOB|nr:hypothetical protein GCM10007939_22820 [Amylibacter marinus]
MDPSSGKARPDYRVKIIHPRLDHVESMTTKRVRCVVKIFVANATNTIERYDTTGG